MEAAKGFDDIISRAKELEATTSYYWAFAILK
jgi:hypothetical protein